MTSSHMLNGSMEIILWGRINDMRILYVAFDNPAVDTILGGMNDETLAGLPAFYYPFKMLLEKGNTVDMLLVSDLNHEVIESEHFKKDNLIQLRPKPGKLGSLMFPFYLARETRKLLKSRHYDFVYGMAEGSHMGVRAAAKMGIPCALRQYGTQEMANVLEPMKKGLRRWLKSFKDYTYITLSMISRKSFLLATNDGSRADELYDILGVKKKKFDFYFWRSAVAIPNEQPAIDTSKTDNYPETYGPMVLSHIGRIADVKRQDRSVRILGELHKRGYKFHLYFIGDVSSQEMLAATMKAAEEYGVTDYLHFEGGKIQTECRKYARNSFAALLPGEWNRVNIFYEVMGEGSVVVTNNNHSIDEFIEDGENCLVYDTEAEAAEKIIALMSNSAQQAEIRANAHKTAIDKFMTLERRFGMETQLVMDTAEGKDTRNYPPVI